MICTPYILMHPIQRLTFLWASIVLPLPCTCILIFFRLRKSYGNIWLSYADKETELGFWRSIIWVYIILFLHNVHVVEDMICLIQSIFFLGIETIVTLHHMYLSLRLYIKFILHVSFFFLFAIMDTGLSGGSQWRKDSTSTTL